MERRRKGIVIGLVVWGVVMCGASYEAMAQIDAAARQARATEVAERLNGAEWVIELTPMSGEGAKATRQDTLLFADGKITSKQLSAKGYNTTNYTLTIGDDGTPVWETMQTSEAEGVAFWRGELREDGMRGILSKHPLEGNAEDYSFVGRGEKRVATEKKAEPAQKAASETAAASPSMAPASAPIESVADQTAAAAPAVDEATAAVSAVVEPIATATAEASTEAANASSGNAVKQAPVKASEPKQKKGWFGR